MNTIDKKAADVAALALDMRRRLEPVYGPGEARDMVRLLFHAFKGWNATDLVIHGDAPVSEWLRAKCEDAVTRVLSGEPVQYVAGEAYFYGMDFHVAPGVLIPRPETAELVDLIVKENPAADLRVLDVGTGSGAIAVALARNLKFPEVTAIDISDRALDIARRNAERLKARIDIRKEDVFTFTSTPRSFDLIVSNPPYITENEKIHMEANVIGHEPDLALFVSDDNPLVYYSRIAEVGREALVAGGRLYFEINPL